MTQGEDTELNFCLATGKVIELLSAKLNSLEASLRHMKTINHSRVNAVMDEILATRQKHKELTNLFLTAKN
ncbi:MAG: hypothetical protein KF900_14115 [Bacteroidetes bacterium]|nr:hypothetical protein [Bacteroidota bacterium]